MERLGFCTTIKKHLSLLENHASQLLLRFSLQFSFDPLILLWTKKELFLPLHYHNIPSVNLDFSSAILFVNSPLSTQFFCLFFCQGTLCICCIFLKTECSFLFSSCFQTISICFLIQSKYFYSYTVDIL